MPATDFQSLLFDTNVPCYLNSPTGFQRLFRLSLLQDIANAIAPNVPTDYQSLLASINVPCYISESEDATQLLRLGILQNIATTLGGGGGGGGGVTWTPSTPIAGTTLVEWLKGDSLTGSSGSSISDWPATVGTDATQPVGANQPTVLTGTYFLPVARFNGTSSIMGISAAGAATQPFTLAMFFSYRGSAANTLIINGGGAGGIGTTSGGQFYGFSSTAVNLKSSDNQAHILVAMFNGAASTFSFDGASLVTFPSNPGTNAWAASSLNLGAGAGVTSASQVDVGEILIWEGDATSGYSNIFNYLSQRWLIG